MKKYLLKINKVSRKFLLKLSEKNQDLILKKLDILQKGNFSILDIKELEPKKLEKYRLRAGKYRIIFIKNDNIFLIEIIKIGSRGNIYK